MANKVDVELIETVETNKKGITFNLERIDDTYTLYKEEFGEREDFLVYNEDVEFMKKILNFLVYAYNEGMNTGKYEALMFNM